MFKGAKQVIVNGVSVRSAATLSQQGAWYPSGVAVSAVTFEQTLSSLSGDEADGATVGTFSATGDAPVRYEILTPNVPFRMAHNSLCFAGAPIQGDFSFDILAKNVSGSEVISVDISLSGAPEKIADADWNFVSSVAPSGDAGVLTIDPLPDQGAGPITALQYQLNGGAWVSLASVVAGPFALTVPAFAAGTMRVRAINASGPGVPSDPKDIDTRTLPTALADGDWTSVPGSEKFVITFDPADFELNGGTLQAVKASYDGGTTFVTLSGIVAGSYDAPALGGVEADVTLFIETDIGTSLVSDVKTGTPTSSLPASVAFDGFSRSDVVFDSGGMSGVNAAAVPVVGVTTGETGKAVNARIVDGSGTVLVNPVSLGVSDGNGDFNTTIDVPRDPDAMFVEVETSGGWTRMGQSFRSGYAGAVFSQSEIAYTFASPVTPRTAVIPGTGYVELCLADGSIQQINEGNPVSAPIAALAESLLNFDPDGCFSVAFHSWSATNPMDTVNDAVSSNRDYATEDAVLAAKFTVDGVVPAFRIWQWWHSTSSLGENWAEVIAPVLTGKLLNGTAIDYSSTYTHTVDGVDYLIDHSFADLYPGAGPWIFQDQNEMAAPDLVYPANGSAVIEDEVAQRNSVANFETNLSEHFRSGRLFGPSNYSWEKDADNVHPADTEDGDVRVMRNVGANLSMLWGTTPFDQPQLDASAWVSTHVDLTSTEGDITTYREANAEAQPTWSGSNGCDVMGMELNGFPVTRAELVGGAVRVFPPDGWTLDGLDVVSRGGQNMGALFDSDIDDEAWKSNPVLEVAGLPGLDGVDLDLALANAASDLPVPDQFSIADTVDAYIGSATGPASIRSITYEADVTFDADVSDYFLDFANGGLQLRSSTGGRIIWLVKDSAGATVASGLYLDCLKTGRRARLRMSIDMGGGGAGQLIIWIDGHKLVDEVVTAGSGIFGTARYALTARSNGASADGKTFRAVRAHWATDATAFSSDPTTAFTWDAEVAGDAATANASPLKLGAGDFS